MATKNKFDDQLKELNSVVEELGNPNVELEKSLDLFKKGKELITNLEDLLKDIDKKTVELIKK